MVGAFPPVPAMTFIEDEQWVVAYFGQNEVRKIEPGNEAEIALKTYPARIIKCDVEAIIWATAQGQLPISGMLPTTGFGAAPDMRLAVKLRAGRARTRNFSSRPAPAATAPSTPNSGKRDPHPPQGVHARRRQARLADPQAALTDMSARHTCLASAIAVVLAGCAVTAPPAPEQIRKDALQGTEIRASWSAGAAVAKAPSATTGWRRSTIRS